MRQCLAFIVPRFIATSSVGGLTLGFKTYGQVSADLNFCDTLKVYFILMWKVKHVTKDLQTFIALLYSLAFRTVQGFYNSEIEFRTDVSLTLGLRQNSEE